MPKHKSDITWTNRADQDGKRIVEGQLSCRHAKMIFTIRPIVKGKYRYVGNLRVLSRTSRNKTLTDGRGKRIGVVCVSAAEIAELVGAGSSGAEKKSQKGQPGICIILRTLLSRRSTAVCLSIR